MAALRKILLKLFIFLLPLVLCFFYFEYQLRNHHFVSSYAAKKYFLEKDLNNIETLILGSSQTFNGIDPSCFSSKAFNLANVSQTIFYDKRLTLLHLSKMPKLKNVIINISYFSFFYQLTDIQEKWRENYYLQHFGINNQQNNTISLEKYSIFFAYKPMHSFNLAFHQFTDKNAKEILANGYQPKFIQEPMSDLLGQQRVLLHNAENFNNRRREIEEDLESFVNHLRTKNIRIFFVTTPVFSSYSKFCNKNIIAANTSFVNKMCYQYQCKYFNFFEDKRFIQEDFFDNDHLKDNGAKKLSIILNDTIKNSH